MASYADEPVAPAPQAGLTVEATRQFPGWLNDEGLSLAFTTYQTGKLFLLGLQESGRLSVFERTFNRCMGLHADEAGEVLYMSSLYQLWRFSNTLPKGGEHKGYDRLYVPQVGHTTGDCDIHDIGVDDQGKPVFVNTLFSCLATLSDDHSFEPLWQPPWISRLAAEDRCHLNGLAMEAGRPRYVTSVSQSDVMEGWREHRESGGVLFDVAAGEVALGGLSMPHSPRLHNGRVWLLESGTGFLGYADLDAGRFERVAFCPGFLRGMALFGDYAVVGVSMGRENKTFKGLALDANLASRGVSARCGLLVINLTSGDIVHAVNFSGVVEELYDVVVLRGVRRPMALGFKSDEIRRVISLPETAA